MEIIKKGMFTYVPRGLEAWIKFSFPQMEI